MKNQIAQGAEAKIYLQILAEQPIIYKQRIQKSYRLKKLDEKIRKQRTKKEARVLTKALEAKINVPKLHEINKEKHTLLIEFIEGERLSETLNSKTKKQQLEIMQKIGTEVSKLHEQNIIHGDLTTSNIILQDKTNKIFIIDFGLSFISHKIENKAVDLHLIKQALEAKHHQNHEKLFTAFLKKYSHPDSKKVVERLKQVEKRGRYKH